MIHDLSFRLSKIHKLRLMHNQKRQESLIQNYIDWEKMKDKPKCKHCEKELTRVEYSLSDSCIKCSILIKQLKRPL